MGQIANITVFDGAAVPVSHTLLAISVTREKGKIIALWRENAAGVPVNAQISMTMTLEQSPKSGVYRCEKRTVVPVMESVSGQNSSGYTAAPKVAYENTFITMAFYHERSVTEGRRLVRQLALNIDANVSTSVVPATAGPAPEFFDLLICPT